MQMGKLKTTKYVVKFDILKAEQIAENKEGFDGRAALFRAEVCLGQVKILRRGGGVGDREIQIVDRLLVFPLSHENHGARVEDVGIRTQDVRSFRNEFHRIDIGCRRFVGQRDEKRQIVENDGATSADEIFPIE